MSDDVKAPLITQRQAIEALDLLLNRDNTSALTMFFKNPEAVLRDFIYQTPDWNSHD